MDKAMRDAFGEALVDLGKKRDDIVVLDADLSRATKTIKFAQEFPNRFFNLGIAESNMAGVAAGMAHSGLVPFISTFALFGTGRAYEIVRNSIAYVNANVKCCFTHAGISVGEDGGSHQSIEDIALMREMPNMTVFIPCDHIETKKAVFAAADINGPVYIRVGRVVSSQVTDEDSPFIPGKANILKDGNDVCIIACGLMTSVALEASKKLEKEGIAAAVVNMHTIKPLDREIIFQMGKRCKGIVTVEEHSIYGGLGSAVAEAAAEKGDIRVLRVGIEDKFGKSGRPEELFKAYGLTAENIINKCKKICLNED